MVTPLDILEPGGTLIIASACSEGFGSQEFRDAQERLVELGPERFLATLTAKTLADIDEWQTEMQLKPMRVGRVQLYTDRPRRARSGASPASSWSPSLDARRGREHGTPRRPRASPSSPKDPTWSRSMRRLTRVRRIHLDAVGGIAGDMFVAAMLDALPELRAPGAG